jgi:hypothetical protein
MVDVALQDREKLIAAISFRRFGNSRTVQVPPSESVFERLNLEPLNRRKALNGAQRLNDLNDLNGPVPMCLKENEIFSAPISAHFAVVEFKPLGIAPPFRVRLTSIGD